MLTMFLEIPLLAAKGVSWLTLKEWQTKSHKVVNDIYKMNPKEIDKTIKEIYDIYRQRLTRLLIDPEEQKQIIDDAMDNIWNLYLENRKKWNG